MSDSTVEPLILDLLEWLSKGDKTYSEVMDAWRTSCPKLPVWEDANDRRLVERDWIDGRELVQVTPQGFALLERSGRQRSLRVLAKQG